MSCTWSWLRTSLSSVFTAFISWAGQRLSARRVQGGWATSFPQPDFLQAGWEQGCWGGSDLYSAGAGAGDSPDCVVPVSPATFSPAGQTGPRCLPFPSSGSSASAAALPCSSGPSPRAPRHLLTTKLPLGEGAAQGPGFLPPLGAAGDKAVCSATPWCKG